MKRNVSLDEISDGRLYGLNDMVKAGCRDCQGCCECCRGMGSSIILDPLDMYRLTTQLHSNFESLMAEAKIELNVVDGVVLPNLKMSGPNESCGFLDKEGQCSIHENRPGICRLFPLGRYYESQGFRYFLQRNECLNNSRTKVKVSKWIDTPDIRRNQVFVLEWHNFLKFLERWMEKHQEEEPDLCRELSL